MKISGLNKLSLLDYPGCISCIVFTNGCNFKCSYCQNSILLNNNMNLINEEDIFTYLNKRKGLIDGVVISGGEPTIQVGLKEFIIKVKKLGYKVKLDTNGYNPEVIKELLDDNLLDYIAMDIKNGFKNYNDVICCKCNINKIIESICIIKNSDCDHEFRTTVIKEYHTYEELFSICDFIGNNSKYYLQQFVDSENVIDKNLSAYSEEELIDIINRLKNSFSNVHVRGLKGTFYEEELICIK